MRIKSVTQVLLYIVLINAPPIILTAQVFTIRNYLLQRGLAQRKYSTQRSVAYLHGQLI